MKNLMNLGKALNKAEQKEINGSGGRPFICNEDQWPPVICAHEFLCALGSNGWYCL